MRWSIQPDYNWKRQFAFLPVLCYTPTPMWVWLEWYYRRRGKRNVFGEQQDDICYTYLPEGEKLG